MRLRYVGGGRHSAVPAMGSFIVLTGPRSPGWRWETRGRSADPAGCCRMTIRMSVNLLDGFGLDFIT
jgi:hypothetical protein